MDDLDQTAENGGEPKLLRALRSERKIADGFRHEATALRAQLAELLPRVEALEARPPATADLGPVLDGLASIRGDLLQQVQALRVEIDELTEQLGRLVRA